MIVIVIVILIGCEHRSRYDPLMEDYLIT